MNKEYTTKQNLWYYTKRFLKTFIPAALVLIPTLGLAPESFIIAVAVPAITTFDKWAREENWYKY